VLVHPCAESDFFCDVVGVRGDQDFGHVKSPRLGKFLPLLSAI
jgi:hypothetical protein